MGRDLGASIRSHEQRDVAWVGSAERVRARYQRYWIPRHRCYEATWRPCERADSVVDNQDPENPRVVRMPA